MATQDQVSAARGVVEAFNAADWDRCKALLTEDSVYDEVGTSRCLAGHGEIIPALQGWREGMPDVTGTIDSVSEAGNTVVLEVTWRGYAHRCAFRAEWSDRGDGQATNHQGRVGHGLRR